MDIKTIVNSAAEKVTSFTRTAVKKGGEAAQTAKLNIALMSEQKKLEKMFATLGKLFYEQVKGTDVRAQVKAQVMEIDEQKLVIEELKAAITESNGKAACEFCGEEIEIDSAYCPACGKAQATVKSEAAPKTEDGAPVNAKPLSCDDFVSFFKDTTSKYFAK